MKVIIADDSRMIRSIIEKVTKSLGYDTLHAGNGQEALDHLEKEGGNVNLILLDWNMPVMDGFTALKKIKQNQKYSKIPVLMISTEAEEEKVQQVMKEGAKGYVSKPFTPEELEEVLKKI